GIADGLKQALKQYTESELGNTRIDTTVAVDVLLEKFEIIQDMLYYNSYDNFNSEKASVRMRDITETMDFVIVLGEEEKKRFMKVVTELGKAFALCATEPEAMELNAEIGFLKAVKAALVKLIPDDGTRRTPEQIDAQLNQLISKSVISDEVID